MKMSKHQCQIRDGKRYILLLTIGLIVFTLYTNSYFDSKYFQCWSSTCNLALPWKSYTNESSLENDFTKEGYVVYTPGCKIMDMDPFESVRKLWKKQKKVTCKPSVTKLLKDKLVLDKPTLKTLGATNFTCCYRAITRVDQSLGKHNKNSDWEIRYSECRNLNTTSNDTNIIKDQFIRVECQGHGMINNTVDFHAQILPPTIKSNGTKRKAEYFDSMSGTGEDIPPSILIIGIDSISRLHMARSLPKTKAFLQKNDFVEVKGYTKVGSNTFPNFMASLAGIGPNNRHCAPKASSVLDYCPLIWKSFAGLNYLTALLEDTAAIAGFNYAKQGFVESPADYYIRPFSVAMHKFHKWSGGSSAASCVGGMSPTDFQAKYITEFFQAMGKSYPYFLHSWFTSIGHDHLNLLKTVDDTFHTLFVNALNAKTANPNNTIIIFMSDHGYRWGAIRATFQGFYEESLPFLFIRIPPKLEAKFPHWKSNMDRNSYQLTTPLDLHRTFEHIFDNARKSISEMEDKSSLSTMDRPMYKERYSLFEYIPRNRTCESASIPERFCMCGVSPQAHQSSNMSSGIGQSVVQNLNDLLKSEIKSGICVPLNMSKFLYGREIGRGDAWNNFDKLINYTDYLYALEVSPSKGQFESKVRVFQNSSVEIMGSISRINLYGKQSACVSDWKLKPYCMCKKR